MVLNGIGGKTVAEAKERMPYSEALLWSAYLKKRGSIHTGMRIENSTALLAMLINRAVGGKSQMTDFMPHADEEVVDLQRVMNLVSGAK